MTIKFIQDAMPLLLMLLLLATGVLFSLEDHLAGGTKEQEFILNEWLQNGIVGEIMNPCRGLWLMNDQN